MPTQSDRLTRIETILEEKVLGELSALRDDIKAIKTELDEDKAELAGLKNKGAGILLGVAIAAGAFGATAAAFAKRVVELLN